MSTPPWGRGMCRRQCIVSGFRMRMSSSSSSCRGVVDDYGNDEGTRRSMIINMDGVMQRRRSSFKRGGEGTYFTPKPCPWVHPWDGRQSSVSEKATLTHGRPGCLEATPTDKGPSFGHVHKNRCRRTAQETCRNDESSSFHFRRVRDEPFVPQWSPTVSFPSSSWRRREEEEPSCTAQLWSLSKGPNETSRFRSSIQNVRGRIFVPPMFPNHRMCCQHILIAQTDDPRPFPHRRRICRRLDATTRGKNRAVEPGSESSIWTPSWATTSSDGSIGVGGIYLGKRRDNLVAPKLIGELERRRYTTPS